MSTPVSTGKQMSASLKARLKKCGRSYSSPASSRLTTSSPCGTPSDKSPLSKVQSSTPKACALFKSPALRSCEHGLQTPTCIGKPETTSSSEDATRRTLAEEFNEPDSNECKTDVTADPINIPTPRSSNQGVKRKLSDCANESSTEKYVDYKTGSGKELTLQELQQQRKHLLKVVAEKEEKLRKLKMVKLYRSKNNLDELSALIGKWKSVCQEALPRLLTFTQEPKPTLTKLIDHLQLEHDMIGYCAEEESFS